MKEHDVSQSIAPPTTIPIEIQPSADELMTDWLADRVNTAIDFTLKEAPAMNLQVRNISVFGFESYEESTRVIFVNPEVEGSDEDAYAYWGVLAKTFTELNRQPLPPGATNTDVKVEIMVGW
jgi:hypothetical protein